MNAEQELDPEQPHGSPGKTDAEQKVFGFGTGVWLFLFIPLLNLLFMLAAVAGGTLMFLDLEGEGPEAAAANV